MPIWPDHYPTRCPPEVAMAPAGDTFRFTNRINPKCRDFISLYDLKPEEDWGEKGCQARGLSVYTTKEDCIAAAATIPALKKKKISKAQLPFESGVIAETPSRNTANHKTFWSLISAEDLANFFVPVEQAGANHV